MSKYFLLGGPTEGTNVIATTPYEGKQPPGPNNANMPPQEQSFVLTVIGPGTATAGAQVVGSNDGINWVDYGSALSATGTAPAQATGTTPYKHFGAYLTTISSGGLATLTMSA